MLELTKRQVEILEFIKSYQKKNGYSPTIKDVADKFEFQSANGARDHLQAMCKKQVIKMSPGIARSIVIL